MEYPVLLAHNVLDGAILAGNETPGHELERLRDGQRHTWWQAPSTATQTIEIRAKNSVPNPGFESDLNGWLFFASGGAAGALTRNTTNPINGNADALMSATDADSGDKACFVTCFKTFFFRAGRTYRMMFRALAQSSYKSIRFGFLNKDFSEDSGLYSEGSAYTEGSGHHKDFTPDADGWYRVYIRLLEPGDVQIDDVVVGEVRDVDTLVIDRGHSMAMASITVKYRDDEQADWSNAMSVSVWHTDAPVYFDFDGTKALSWRVDISVWSNYPDVAVAKAPLVYLGRRWELPRNFSGSFDPHREDRFEESVVGERGVAQRSLKFNRRVLKANLARIGDDDYKNIKLFFEDTDNGLKPFFFAWRPASEPDDILLMKLTGARNVPFSSSTLRSWDFEAEEVVGARKI